MVGYWFSYWFHKFFLYSLSRAFWRQLCLFAILVVCLAYFARHQEYGVFGKKSQRNVAHSIIVLERSMRQVKEQNDNLTREIKALGTHPDSDAFDQAIREVIDYANPDEYIIILPEKMSSGQK